MHSGSFDPGFCFTIYTNLIFIKPNLVSDLTDPPWIIDWMFIAIHYTILFITASTSTSLILTDGLTLH